MREITNEKRQFLLDLGVWLKPYIKEIGEIVLRHVDELFDDKTVVYLARTYAEDRKRQEHDDETALYDAYVYEVAYTKGIILKNVEGALYLLCYKRFENERDEKEGK